ncbi:MAG: hypothetical protein EHM48_07005 [Planctomycetaceae bacterium]|nr:MAG: hypothetical protein EHM48_07005 [Planctomycetaceae bacterium]
MKGFEAKLYFSATPLAGLPSTATWTELSIVKDITLNDELEETDVTTRSGAGRKATDVGMRDNSIDLEITWTPGNGGFDAMLAAYKGRNLIAIAVMDGDIATAGKTGVASNWKVTKFTRNEPLGGQVTANVTIKANSFMADYTVVGA